MTKIAFFFSCFFAAHGSEVCEIQELNPIVEELKQNVETNDTFAAEVNQILVEGARLSGVSSIPNYDDMYTFFNNVLKTAPRITDPIGVDLMILNYTRTPTGNLIVPQTKTINWFYNWLYQWNIFLNSTESTYVLPEWYEIVNMSDYIIPENGFKSWNDFFTRQIKPNVRSIDSKNNSNIITSPVDGTVSLIAFNTTNVNTINIKGINYNLTKIFQNEKLANYFENGTAIMISLGVSNYHHFHSYIDGYITHLYQLGGFYYYWPSKLNPSLNINDIDSITALFMTFDEYNRRGIFCINSTNSANVQYNSCYIPVGAGACNSIIFNATVGDELEKGQRIGNFAWGGSTSLLLFPQNIVKSVLVQVNQPVKMGQAIAIL